MCLADMYTPTRIILHDQKNECKNENCLIVGKTDC